MKFIFLMLILLGSAQAETLTELLKKEETSIHEPCPLTKPKDASGERFEIVVPSRFPDPHHWVTKTLLLVGLKGDQVVYVKELPVSDGIGPRAVLSIECKNNKVTIRQEKTRTLIYKWDGKALKRSRK